MKTGFLTRARFFFLLTSIITLAGSVSPVFADEIEVSAERLQQDALTLATVDPPRNAKNIIALNRIADHILAEFQKSGGRIEVQRFLDGGKEYRNVICSFGPQTGERVIVGAHYDVHGELPGADDNASGIAVLLELSRLIRMLQPALKYRVDLAAYTLEEDQLWKHPFARHYGSHIHAKSLAQAGVQVRAMLCLEMIGYFSDQPHSQKFPFFFFRWFYPDKGNFIAVVGKWGQGDLVRKVKRLMTIPSSVPVESLTAPSFLPGISFSDHQSYWQFDYPAVMITDTAFFRNKNYHKAKDKPETLDYTRMAEVAKELYEVLLNL